MGFKEDFVIFQQYAYDNMVEEVRDNVELFNAASDGTIVLTGGTILGDYRENTFWPLKTGLVRRRNVYGTGTVSQVTMAMDKEASVKIAAGTDELLITPAYAKWIQQDPMQAAVVYGQQLAQQQVQDMVQTAVLALTAALENDALDVVKDITGETLKTMNPRALSAAGGLFGDKYGDIRCWIMHSAPFFDLIDHNLANAQMLFTYGSVKVMSDPFGRRFIISDLSNLVDSTVYSTLGLTGGAVVVEGPNDYDTISNGVTGKENLQRVMQSEWTYNMTLKAYSWAGDSGHVTSPDDTALGSSANWVKKRQSVKDLPGVILKTN